MIIRAYWSQRAGRVASLYASAFGGPVDLIDLRLQGDESEILMSVLSGFRSPRKFLIVTR